MLRRSRPSARQSTTSSRTSRAAGRAGVGSTEPTMSAGAGSAGAGAGNAGPAPLRKLIDELPPSRLEHVFTHASWAADRALSYERLEFLGDSVLELAVARALYDRYPEFSEGRLAKMRSHVVSRQSCAQIADELELGPMLASRGGDAIPREELERLVVNRNVLAALLEAALAAAFLEWGFEAVEPAVV